MAGKFDLSPWCALTALTEKIHIRIYHVKSIVNKIIFIVCTYIKLTPQVLCDNKWWKDLLGFNEAHYVNYEIYLAITLCLSSLPFIFTPIRKELYASSSSPIKLCVADDNQSSPHQLFHDFYPFEVRVHLCHIMVWHVPKLEEHFIW